MKKAKIDILGLDVFSKRLILLVATCFILCGTKAQVTVEAKLDSAGIYIGKRMGITLEVSANAKSVVELPPYDSLQMIVPGVEFLSETPVDTEFVNDRKRMVLRKKYYVTSFDTALYNIPPMEVKVDGKVFKSKNLGMKVIIPFEVDTVHVDSIFGLKGEMEPPFVWEDWSLVLWLSILSVVITVMLIYVAVRLKDNKPIIKRIRTKKRLAPHKVAMQKIEEIKEDKLWQSEDSKEYYTQLTDTIRQYIKERYGFNALEMTSFEIITKLQEVNDEEAINELRELFQTADLVKFAKYSTMINENDRNLVTAIAYINQTKQEETEEQKAQPEEIVVVEPHSRMTKRLLIAGVVLAAVVLIGVVGYLCYRIYMLTL